MIRAAGSVKSVFLALSFTITFISFSSYPAESFANERAQISPMPSQNDAVMIIRFNQQYVYFENALKKVVDKVYSIKPNAAYEIQSVIPADKKNDDNAKKYLDNLRSIVAEFNRLGVSRDRISVRTDVTDLVDSQEVNIFVR